MILCFVFLCLWFASSAFFFFTPPSTTELYTLSLHDALPISTPRLSRVPPTMSSGSFPAPSGSIIRATATKNASRSEEHTSELQSRFDLVCRLLLEKKKKKKKKNYKNKISRQTVNQLHCRHLQ